MTSINSADKGVLTNLYQQCVNVKTSALACIRYCTAVCTTYEVVSVTERATHGYERPVGTEAVCQQTGLSACLVSKASYRAPPRALGVAFALASTLKLHGSMPPFITSED